MFFGKFFFRLGVVLFRWFLGEVGLYKFVFILEYFGLIFKFIEIFVFCVFVVCV